MLLEAQCHNRQPLTKIISYIYICSVTTSVYCFEGAKETLGVSLLAFLLAKTRRASSMAASFAVASCFHYDRWNRPHSHQEATVGWKWFWCLFWVFSLRRGLWAVLLHPTSQHLLSVCRRTLFWKNGDQKRSRFRCRFDSKSVFYVFAFFIPASLFLSIFNAP